MDTKKREEICDLYECIREISQGQFSYIVLAFSYRVGGLQTKRDISNEYEQVINQSSSLQSPKKRTYYFTL